MARFREYRELRSLDDPTLRDLCERGDAPERLWAAWELARRCDPGTHDRARDLADHDPSPGIRAHMVVLLLCQGDRPAVMALGRYDPDAQVRASALLHLTRLAAPDDAILYDFVTSVLEIDPAPAVREVIASVLRPDAPESVWRACVERLDDADRDVRAAAVDALLRRDRPPGAFPVELRRRAEVEHDDLLRKTLLRAWIAAEGASAFVHHVATRPVPDVVRTLHFIGGEGHSLSTGDVEPLLERDEPALDKAVADLVEQKRVELPLRWLLELFLRVDYEALDGMDAQAAAKVYRGHRYLAMLATFDAIAPAVVGASRLSRRERELAAKLEEVLERWGTRACAGQDFDVETLTRYYRQELDETTQARLAALDDEDRLPGVRGLWLLPELRRLLGS
jgi:hypothetical protein